MNGIRETGEDDGYYDVSLKSDGDLLISHIGNLEKEYDKYKIASNVLNFYIIYDGMRGRDDLYYINSDGSVSYVQYYLSESEERIKQKITNNYGSLKNIVSVISLEGRCDIQENHFYGNEEFSAFFIDINENVYG